MFILFLELVVAKWKNKAAYNTKIIFYFIFKLTSPLDLRRPAWLMYWFCQRFGAVDIQGFLGHVPAGTLGTFNMVIAS